LWKYYSTQRSPITETRLFFAGFARLSLWQAKHVDEDEHAALAE
jgi:hypothetical protein